MRDVPDLQQILASVDAALDRDPRRLMCFLRGIEIGDRRFIEPAGRITDRLRERYDCTLSLAAGTIAYLFAGRSEDACGLLVGEIELMFRSLSGSGSTCVEPTMRIETVLTEMGADPFRRAGFFFILDVC